MIPPTSMPLPLEDESKEGREKGLRPWVVYRYPGTPPFPLHDSPSRPAPHPMPQGGCASGQGAACGRYTRPSSQLAPKLMPMSDRCHPHWGVSPHAQSPGPAPFYPATSSVRCLMGRSPRLSTSAWSHPGWCHLHHGRLCRKRQEQGW